MDLRKLFERYSVAIVSKKITRASVCARIDKLTKQRLSVLEKREFDTQSYKIYEKIDEYLKEKGL